MAHVEWSAVTVFQILVVRWEAVGVGVGSAGVVVT